MSAGAPGSAGGAHGRAAGPGRGVAPGRDLTPLFDPHSIAVVGASSDASKWGGDVAARLARGEGRRHLYFVNRRGGRVQGREAYRSLRELPEAPDMVVLAVPAQAFEDAVEDALAVGARALVGIFAGLGETGAAGKARERAAVARLRAAGAVMIGPNCMGVADTSSGLQAVAYLDVPAGGLAFVSQSGGLGEELVVRAHGHAVGFSRYVTLGNQADLTMTEVLRSLVDHEPTRVVAVYGEDVGDGRAFARAARDLVASGRPVVLLSPGRTAASVRAARSHTGSLAPDAAVLDAACDAAGVVRVATVGQLFDAAVCLLPGRRARGRRLAVVSDGGGHGGLAADAAAAVGLDVSPLSPGAVDGVRAALATCVGENPFDFAIGTIEPGAYGAVVDAVVEAEGVDAVLAVGQLGYWGARFAHFTNQVEAERDGARRIAAAAARSGTPVAVCSTYPRSPAAAVLREGGVPVYHETDAAVAALGHLAGVHEAEVRLAAEREGRRADTLPDVPPPAPPLVDLSGVRPTGDAASLAREYWRAREALAAAGIETVAARRARDADEATAAAADLGYPVVVKALGLLHKSDRGGVALGLTDAMRVRGVCAEMAARLAPPEFAVEREAPLAGGVELILGCRWDPHFGPVVLLGLGGLFAEVLQDVRLALAPVSEEGAAELLGPLRGAPLLSGARGRPPLALAAAAGAAAALSRFAAAHPEFAELEVNPLLVTADAAVALDARLVWTRPGRAAGDGTDFDTGVDGSRDDA